MIQGYRGDLIRQRKLWKPVVAAVADWRRDYDQLHRKPGADPILGYLDGRDFLILRHRRGVSDTATHRLSGLSRELYLFCGRARSLGRIRERFNRLPEDRLVPFLREMTAKKLMYSEDSLHLSLAVPLARGADR